MRWLKYAWIPGAALVALGLTIGLYAQPVVQNTFSGLECWNAGQGPGGPTTGFVCGQAYRGGANNLALTMAGAWTVGTTSANTTPNNTTTLAYGGRVMLTAQPTAGVITLPASPLMDGITVAFCNVTTSPFATNVVTVTNNTGQTLGPGAGLTLTTLAANTCQIDQWSLANTTWYRVQ